MPVFSIVHCINESYFMHWFFSILFFTLWRCLFHRLMPLFSKNLHSSLCLSTMFIIFLYVSPFNKVCVLSAIFFFFDGRGGQWRVSLIADTSSATTTILFNTRWSCALHSLSPAIMLAYHMFDHYCSRISHPFDFMYFLYCHNYSYLSINRS